ncbi:MAG: hypothetical protein ACJAZ2_001190 [Glaciecola sp.]|jgi:hypothetical protein
MIQFSRILVTCFLTVIITSASAQKNKLSLGTQIPLNYAAAYEENVYGGFYVNYHFGYLTDPYTKVLFAEAETRGLDAGLSNLLEEYFQRGISHQGQIKYAPDFFKGFYLGGSFKRKNIRAIEIPYQVAADHFGVDLTPFQSNPFFLALISDLDFNITMTIPGIFIGKSFQLGESNWSLYSEISYHKIINSTSLVTFTGGVSEVPLLNDPVNKEVRSALDENGNLFSLNIGVSYTLPFSINRAVASLFKRKEREDKPQDN